MPKQPGFLDKWNAIIRYIEDPCVGAPWLLYVELALPPLGNAIVTWFGFGLDDVIRGYFRPKGLRTGRHGRGGKRGGKPRTKIGKAISRIPGLGDDVGNTIGKALPGATEARGRHVSQGVKQLWIVDNFLQRGLFYWLVADMITDFLYEWTSLLQESEFCKRTYSAGVYATGDGGGLAFGNIWFAVEAPNIIKSSGFVGWNVSTATFARGKWTAIMGAEYQNLATQPVVIEGRIRGTIDGKDYEILSGEVEVEPNASGQIVMSADLNGEGNAIFEARTSITAATGVSADVWVTGEPA